MSNRRGSGSSSVDRSASGESSGRLAKVGRPREVEVDVAINRAVLVVLHEAGYGGLTYEQVAISAGVSRPTLYRRATNKAALVVTAMVDSYGLAPVPDTGSIEGDLTALQRAQLRLYNDPVIAAALPGLLADIRTDDEARTAWVDGFVGPRRAGVAAAVERAIVRGELVHDTDTEWVCEILTGPLVSAAFLTGPPTPAHQAREGDRRPGHAAVRAARDEGSDEPPPMK